MIDHILLKVKVAGDVQEGALQKIIEDIYKVHLDVFLVESEAVEQSVQRTGGESGQQNLFSAGDTLPAKVTRQSTRR